MIACGPRGHSEGHDVGWTDGFFQAMPGRGRVIERAITANWAVMAKYDPGHRIKLIVDEWGLWYAGTPLESVGNRSGRGLSC